MTDSGENAQPEVSLGKAAIFFLALAFFGLCAGAFGIWILGFIGVISAIAAVGLAFLHFRTRRP